MARALEALGRRIKSTPEIKKAGLGANIHAVLNYKRDGEDLYISLHDYVIEVLKDFGII
ncbi:MAG: hypothetical protein IIC79_05740 [Chloroflexi bacterium]|nr:hypothetical protein [Chloroflexota bacterium]